MSIITELGENFEHVPTILTTFENEFKNAAKDLRMKGRPLDELLIEQASLAGYYQLRQAQLRTIRKYVETCIEKARGKLWKYYTEKVQRELQYRDKDHYINTEDRIMELKTVYHTVAELEDKYEAMSDALKQRGFALNNIVKIRVAGLDGAIVL